MAVCSDFFPALFFSPKNCKTLNTKAQWLNIKWQKHDSLKPCCCEAISKNLRLPGSSARLVIMTGYHDRYPGMTWQRRSMTSSGRVWESPESGEMTVWQPASEWWEQSVNGVLIDDEKQMRLTGGWGLGWWRGVACRQGHHERSEWRAQSGCEWFQWMNQVVWMNNKVIMEVSVKSELGVTVVLYTQPIANPPPCTININYQLKPNFFKNEEKEKWITEHTSWW